jgi:hypothetical protein
VCSDEVKHGTALQKEEAYRSVQVAFPLFPLLVLSLFQGRQSRHHPVPTAFAVSLV